MTLARSNAPAEISNGVYPVPLTGSTSIKLVHPVQSLPALSENAHSNVGADTRMRNP